MPSIVHSSKRGVAVGATPTQTEQVSPARLKTILLVEDQEVCRITTKWFLANFGYAVVTARSAEEALALFVPEIHDVVVTDNNMAGLTGTELAHIIKLRSPATPVIMYTGEPPADPSCLDFVIRKTNHPLTLKEAVDRVADVQQPVNGRH